jgi:hypothetical protein
MSEILTQAAVGAIYGLVLIWLAQPQHHLST